MPSDSGPTDRFVDAVRFAVDRHVHEDGTAHLRKGTTVPYLSHLLAVTALVWEAGGDEDLAIAALLHDSLEDTSTTPAELEGRFGPEVARLVQACSDGLDVPGERDATTWAVRKQAYLHHLAEAEPRAQLISAADKLHNATAIVTDAEAELAAGGPVQIWGRFNAPPEKILWYYRGVLEALAPQLGDTSLYRRLAETVERMARLAPTDASRAPCQVT